MAIALCLAPLAAGAQLPDLTDPDEGQTASSDSTWTDGSMEAVDTVLPVPQAKAPARQSVVRQYVVDINRLPDDFFGLFGNPFPAVDRGPEAGFPAGLAPWNYAWPALRPFFAASRSRAELWAGIVLLLLAGAGCIASYRPGKTGPAAASADEADALHYRELRTGLLTATCCLLGAAAFLYWPAAAAALLIGLRAALRYSRQRHGNVPPPPNSEL